MGQYMIRKVCFFRTEKKMRFIQTELILQTENRSELAKNRFSVALVYSIDYLLNNKRYCYKYSGSLWFGQKILL